MAERLRFFKNNGIYREEEPDFPLVSPRQMYLLTGESKNFFVEIKEEKSFYLHIIINREPMD